MFDYNQDAWKPELLKHIGAEALPVEYGGKGPAVFEDAEDENSNM